MEQRALTTMLRASSARHQHHPAAGRAGLAASSRSGGESGAQDRLLALARGLALDGRKASWALAAGVNVAVLGFVAWRLWRSSHVQLERLDQLKASSKRLWTLATQGAEAAGAVPEDLGEPDEHGVFTHRSATGVLYFRQSRCSSLTQRGNEVGVLSDGGAGGAGGAGALHWEWSTDKRFWLPTSSADSLWFSPNSRPSCSDQVLIRRLEVEAQLLARQALAQPPAAEALPPLDLSQATRNLSQVDQIPAAFLCPISMLVMTQPVVTPSGASFDRPALLEWIRTHHTDPASGHPLRSNQIVPNLVLRDMIHAWAHSGEPKKQPHAGGGIRVLL